MDVIWGFFLVGMILANAIVHPSFLSIALAVLFALTIAVEVGKKLS